MDVTSAELREIKTKQLIYDLDKDGVADVLDCNFWDRWGDTMPNQHLFKRKRRFGLVA